MRKKEYCPWLPVVRLSHSSSRLYRTHVFLPDKKTLRELTARFLSITILFRQRLPPVRLLIDH